MYLLNRHCQYYSYKDESLTTFLRGCYLLSLLRPILPSVGEFAISSDGYFFSNVILKEKSFVDNILEIFCSYGGIMTSNSGR